jgi:hypothetical protein
MAVRNSLQGWTEIGNAGPASKVKSRRRNSLEETMPRKPTIDDARLILQLYDLRREAELRKK